MENSHIQWTDHTFNGWIGCTKVSPGCAHCYAEARDKRFAEGIHWGKGAPRQRTSAGNWREPIRWARAAEAAEFSNKVRFETEREAYDGAAYKPLHRQRVFCASLSDWLDDEVPIEWLLDLLALIHRCPELDWQLLTKRPENWEARIKECYKLSFHNHGAELSFWIQHWIDGDAPSNIWAGTSVENQKCADERIPELLKIPGKIRFLSCEPLLGPVTLRDVPNVNFGEGEPHYDALLGRAYDSYGDGTNGPRVHWIIVGGESGSEARSFNLDWAREIVADCRNTNTPLFMKQLGRAPIEHQPGSEVGGVPVVEACDFPILLNDKKGGDISEWPVELRVREFPA